MPVNDLSIIEHNERFLDMLEKNAGDVRDAGRNFIKTELQESAFSRAIIPQEPITTSDCQPNANDDSLYVLRDIEPDAEAVSVDNVGEPDGKYVKGTRYIIPIINFATKRFQITVEDLRAYRYKVTKRIEDKTVPVLEELEDRLFLRLAGAALVGNSLGAAVKKAVEGVNEDADDLYLHEKDFVNIKNTLAAGLNGADAKRKEVGCLLMTQETYNTAVSLPGAGDDFGKDRVLNGIVSEVLYGTKVITTIKSNLLPVGHVWAFTTPDFLGHNFALGEPTFEIKKEFNLIEWQSRESIGLGIGNALSVALLTMQGSKNPNTGDPLAVTTNGTVPQAITDYYAGIRLATKGAR